MFKDKVSTKIIYSISTDPWYNLALEEYLLDKVGENEIYLYLWQNKDTVVIGRNQNPWKECRCKALENAGGKLARRLSGGGAVFHDLGNLNFTFVMDKELYDLSKQLQVIIDAVNKLGIDAKFSGRNDITIDEKKFSGNAFYFKERSAYHHGTILIDVDLSKLTRYLQVSNEKIVSKGIDSIKSRVVNLKSLNKNICVESVKESLIESFISIYGGDGDKTEIEKDKIDILYDKYSSWEWRYGQTPRFDITFLNRFNWGEIELGLCLRDGYVTSAVIYSDAMNSNFIQKIAVQLEGVPFNVEDVVNRIHSVNTSNNDEEKIIEDIRHWILSKSTDF